MPLIVDGKVQEDVLVEVNKSHSWLKKELSLKNLSSKDIFYAFLKKNKIYVIRKSDVA